MTSSSSTYLSSFLSWMLFGSKVLGTVVVGVTLLLYFNQDKILYIPNPPGIPRTPEENPRGYRSPNDWSVNGRVRREGDVGIPFEDHMIRTKDNVDIHVWLLHHPQAENATPHPTLIYFHGNAANMGFRLPNAALMYSECKMNILMVDYRGYGKSGGSPTETGLQLDAEAALEFVRTHPKLQGSPVVVFGRSLGGAVSLYLARRYPSSVAGIVIENTFLSVSAMTDILLPLLKPLKPYLLRMYWDSGDAIVGVDQPVMFISGGRDELVPPAHMRALYDLATASRHREWFFVEDGSHNDTWEKAGAHYYKRMRAFINNYIRSDNHDAVSSGSSSDDDNNAGNGGIDEAVKENKEDLDSISGGGASAAEEDYYLVSIPTMGTDFNVHQKTE